MKATSKTALLFFLAFPGAAIGQEYIQGSYIHCNGFFKPEYVFKISTYKYKDASEGYQQYQILRQRCPSCKATPYYAEIQFVSSEDPEDIYSSQKIRKGSFDSLPFLKVDVREDKYPLPRVQNGSTRAQSFRSYGSSDKQGYLDRIEGKLHIDSGQVINCRRIDESSAVQILKSIQSKFIDQISPPAPPAF
jgi:hypothetical protein